MWNALCLALVSELVHALLLDALLFIDLADCTCWFGCRCPVTQWSMLCDIVHDMVDTKRQGHDGALLMMLWQVELASVGELQVEW